MKQNIYTPQVKYSLDALSKALFTLMENDSYEEITITQICQYANITRTTFYRNCRDKKDLVDYAIATHVYELLESVPWSIEVIVPMYHNFFTFWYERKAFLSILKKQGLFHRFYALFTEINTNALVLEKHNPALQINTHDEQMKLYRSSFIIGGLCNILEKWCEQDFITSIPLLVDILLERIPSNYKK